MANSGEYKSKVGLDRLYIAEVTADSSSAYTAGTPEYLAPAAEASLEPSTSFDTQYADDQAYDVSSSEGETKISLTVTGIPLETLAKITGRVFDETTGRMYDNGGVAPYFALSFRSLKSNGKYIYYQFLKGKFDMPKEETATKAEKAEPKTLQLTYTAIRTTYQFDLGDINDSVKRVVGDEDTTNFSGTSWFTTVQVPGVASVSALALSTSTPADDASGVSKTANLTLTYNNALVDGVVNSVTLLDNTQAVVAAAVTLDATKKIVTIDPTASLAGSTAHTLVANATDIYGQTLTSVITFTTAA
jgi:phi13 family phage major tail protein